MTAGRSKVAMLVGLAAGCTTGPDQPQYFWPPALVVRGHINDQPASSANAFLLMVALWDSGGIPTTNLFRPTVSGDFEVVVSSVPDSGGTGAPYRLYRAVLNVNNDSFEATNDELAFSASDALYRPFGPNDQPLTLPKGYSWLHRSCKADGRGIQMQIVPADQRVMFERVKAPPMDTDPAAQRSASEGALLMGCAVTPPPASLGQRFALDSGKALAWSPDGQAIFYLGGGDPADPGGLVGVRRARLGDGFSEELGTVPFGRDLAVGPDGTLFVADAESWSRLVPDGAGQLKRQTLPVPSGALLSPDGRWFALTAIGDSKTRVWDSSTGTVVPFISGSMLGWSADSSLALRLSPMEIVIRRPSEPAPAQRFTFADPGPVPIQSVILTQQGPVLVMSPLDWLDYQDPMAMYLTWPPRCVYCFGLALQDVGDNPWRQVLDGNEGQIEMVAPTPGADFALLWARKCLGLQDTVCTATLLRVRIADGAASMVAVASAPLPLAVSPDRRRVALAALGGLYVQDIP